jgi:L-lactate dehydrogenase
MKVGVVGVGRVGAACALSLVVRGSAPEVVLVDRTRARAGAVATDLRYGAPLCPEVVLRDGDYADLASTDLVMITAGVPRSFAKRCSGHRYNLRGIYI